MNETLEQIALRIAKELDPTADKGCGKSFILSPTDTEEFARRLVAALGAQEPVAWEMKGYTDVFTSDQDIANNPAIWRDLYSAPVVPADWQMIPKSRYAELIRCCEDMATGKGGWAWRDVLDEHKAMLAAAPVVKEGWQMVPKKPTEAMLNSCWRDYPQAARETYKAMLAAAPEYKP